MFIRDAKGGYRKDGEQWAKGPFLVVFSLSHITHPGQQREIRACVRTVSLRQLGHWMMGKAIIGPHRVPLSGSYGADGLPRDPDPFPGLWEKLMPLPESLIEEFWHGGGHNTSGSEGPSIRKWAVENEKLLRKAGS